MLYRNFEDLPIWQLSREFISKIFNLIEKNYKINKNYPVKDQLLRASFSIPLNIAEGFERSSNREFANFINIAKGSAGEVRSIIYILKDNNYLTEVEAGLLIKEIHKISSHLSNFRNYLLNTIKK